MIEVPWEPQANPLGKIKTRRKLILYQPLHINYNYEITLSATSATVTT